MQVVVDGLLTNYIKSGKGRNVLLLHGWGDNSATFHKLSTELSGNFQTISLDLPGFGGTQKPGSEWGLSDYANFVTHFLKKIEAGNIHVLVGHSNGGAISINAVSSGLIKTDKLVLVSSSGIRVPQKSLKSLAKVGKALTSPLPEFVQTKIRKRFYKSLDSEIFLIPHMEQTFRKIVSQDVLNDAAKITIPTLLIYGRDDKDTPPDYANKFHGVIKNSEVKIVEGAGHFVHHDRSPEVNGYVQEFLKNDS